MADWIKVSKEMPDKPKLAIIARKLGITVAEAFLQWFRFYAWADGITEDGRVPNLSLCDGDSLSRVCPKFCETLALPEIGWIVADDGGFTITKWERHNGKSAKARSLDAEKKRKQRAKCPPKCPDARGTKKGLEKRREDTSSKEEVITPEKFVSIWNSLDGVQVVRGTTLTGDRLASFGRRVKDSAWVSSLPEAIAKFPLRCTEGQDAWKPDMDWFLRPNSVTRILEGKYDWSKTQGRNTEDARIETPPLPRTAGTPRK